MANSNKVLGGGNGSKPVITGFSVNSGDVTDNLTNDRTLALTGSGKKYVTVSVYAGDLLLGTTTSDANGDWDFTTVALADGVYSFTAVAYNGPNMNSSDPFVIEIDSVPPDEPEIVSATETESGLELTGSAEAGARVNIYRGVTFLSTVVADDAGNWEYTDGGYPGGVVLYTFNAVDAADNISAETEFRYQNAAPSITSPATASVAENQTAAIDVEATDDGIGGAGLVYSITGGADQALFDSASGTGVVSFKFGMVGVDDAARLKCRLVSAAAVGHSVAFENVDVPGRKASVSVKDI